jgi:hypothetical protein
MKTLQPYEVDEVVTLLSELRYRAEQDDDVDLLAEIDSVIGLFVETKEGMDE